MINVVFTQAPTSVFGCVSKKIQVCGMCFFGKKLFLEHIKIYKDVFAKH